MKKRVLARSLDTRVRILDAAERMFAEKGLEQASMRAITGAAGVNLAAVNYHFGSKEGLVVAVFARRLRPLNEERLRLLGQAEQRPQLRLEDVLTAYMAPVIRLLHDGDRGSVFTRLLVRTLSEPGPYLEQLFREEMEPVLARFLAGLERCLPGLSQDELFWRMHFANGSLTSAVAGGDRLELLSQGTCDPGDVETVIQRLVEFASAGMKGEQVSGCNSSVEGHL